MQIAFENIKSNHHNFTIEEVLTPLALSVIIDNKVRDPEMREFRVQAEGLLDMLGFEGDISALTIMDWYAENELRIKEALQGPKKNTYILKVLTRFTDHQPLIEAIYDSMLAISISDKEYHVDESELIKSAASLWGYERPPFKVIPRA